VLEGWGILFAPQDPGAAADAQVRLIGDRALRLQVAAAGREVCRTRFSLSVMLAEMDRAYLEILGDECV
jgi:glycosyltransferase involved in cell wall biosynthesis